MAISSQLVWPITGNNSQEQFNPIPSVNGWSGGHQTGNETEGSTASRLPKGWVSFHTFVTPSSSGKNWETISRKWSTVHSTGHKLTAGSRPLQSTTHCTGSSTAVCIAKLTTQHVPDVNGLLVVKTCPVIFRLCCPQNKTIIICVIIT